MCGINGYVAFGDRPVGADVLVRMNRALAHRGPDDEGLLYIDPEKGEALDFGAAATPAALGLPAWAYDARLERFRIGLGHRRFSIFDPTPQGHQPFWSADRRVAVVFNGEIYNHVEVRSTLEKLGHAFHTRSDTEVLVEAYREWGTGCFERFNGFWAILLWDAERRALLVARDRLGKAPLYHARRGGVTWFSSEIKAIRTAVGEGAFAPNLRAVMDFVVEDWRDVHDQTFFEGITTFPRASYAWVGDDGHFEPVRWWDLPARLTERDIAPLQAADEFRERLSDAVELRLRADAPVGFELSGGMDSSSLVALGAQHREHLTAFTVSFAGTPSDERAFARAVVRRFAPRVEQIEISPPDDELRHHANDFIAHMDEPFRSPNLFTHQSVWRAIAARGMRVSLNGAAGDELLAGYPEAYFASYVRHLLNERRYGAALRAFVENKDLGGRDALPHALVTAGRLLGLPAARQLYRRRALADDPFRAPPNVRTDDPVPLGFDERVRALMGDWMMNYWLRSGNTAAFAIPLEVRTPFLDHRVVEYAFRLPPTYLIRDGWTKWILRKGLRDLLPAEVTWRRTKMGFPFPHREWLLANRDWLERAAAASDCPLIDARRLQGSYVTLANTNPTYLWRLLSLALWWLRCVEGRRIAA